LAAEGKVLNFTNFKLLLDISRDPLTFTVWRKN